MPQGLSQVLRFERAKEAVICVLVELTSVGLAETSGGHLRGLPTTPTWVPSALKAHLRAHKAHKILPRLGVSALASLSFLFPKVVII